MGSNPAQITQAPQLSGPQEVGGLPIGSARGLRVQGLGLFFALLRLFSQRF